MTEPTPGSPGAIVAALTEGLPRLLPPFLTAIVLLVLGVLIYTALTRFRERALIGAGNVAAALLLGGVVLSLGMPLAVVLATSGALLDIAVWGIVALLIQLLTFALITLLFRDLHRMIEANNVAAGLVMAATHMAVGLLNAAAMVPT